jgi:hypothetical protein
MSAAERLHLTLRGYLGYLGYLDLRPSGSRVSSDRIAPPPEYER